MEVDSVKEMFSRSIDQYGVKYMRYIGDGDSAIFKGLLNFNPYDVHVQKLEWYLHVKKRIGTRCRNLKKQIKGLGGRSKNTVKLTDKFINKLQKYHGLAITGHQDNVDEIYKEIWATLHHLSSIDENPNHGNWPAGANSWCSYRHVEAEGMDVSKFKHDYLPFDSPIAKEYAMERDDHRINQAELRHKASSKEGWTVRRKALASQLALFEEEEGP